ncbi:hypothetical protein WA158_004754 [Blastocystis sp. Blastoise]
MSHEAAEAIKERGNQRLRDGNYSSAELLYTEAIDLEPSNAKYYSNRCTARIHLKKFDEALEDAENIIKNDPNWIKGYIQKGSVLMTLHRYDEAISTFEKANQIEPNNETAKSLYEKVKSMKETTSSDSTNLRHFLIGTKENTVQTIVNASRIIILILFISLLLPIFKFQRSPTIYPIILFFYIIITIASVLYAYGNIQFNMTYLTRVMRDGHVMYVYYLLLFITFKRTPLALFPIILSESRYLLTWFIRLLSYISVSTSNKLIEVLSSIVPRLLQVPNFNSLSDNEKWSCVYTYTSTLCCLWEIIMIVPITAGIFKGIRGIMLVVIYINYLMSRSIQDAYMTNAMRTIDAAITTLVSRLPAFIRNIYYKMRTVIVRMYTQRRGY